MYRVFAFPYAGGSSTSYSEISQIFPEEIEFITVELPGRGYRSREPLIPCLESLAYDAYSQISHLINHSKYLLYGHSMGGLLAYLVAKLIKQSSRHDYAEHMLITGCAAPSYRNIPKISELGNEELIEKIITLDGTPLNLKNEPKLWDFFLPIFRSDFKAFEDYIDTKEVCLDIPLTVIIGNNESLKKPHVRNWDIVTTKSVHFKEMKGGHFFIHENRHELADYIFHCLSMKNNNHRDK